MQLPIRSFLSAAFVAAMVFPASAQVVHDASADFSIINGNPNGAWSYGTLPAAPGTTFTAFAETATGDLNVWKPNGVTTLVPSVARNETGAIFNEEVGNGTISGDTLGVVKLQPGELMLNPGLVGTRVAVRFTAPQTAVYRFQGAFSNSAEDNGAEVDCMLHKGAVELFILTWNVSGSSPLPTGAPTARPFDVSVLMTAGETVDVSVAPRFIGRDSVGLSLTATQLAPGSAADQRWLGGAGNWSDSAKWNFGTVPNNNMNNGVADPGALYNATVDVTGSSPVLNVPVAVQNLTLGIARNSISNGTMISGVEPLTIHDTFNWHYGSLSSSGGITFGPSSTVNVAATIGATQSLSSNILNQGMMTVAPAIINGVPLGEGSANFEVAKTNGTAAAPVFTNDGTFTLHGVADLTATGNGGGQIINNGTFIKSGAADEESFITNTHIFTNNGLVQVTGGRLRIGAAGLGGPYIHAGGYQISEGAVLSVEGYHTFNAGAGSSGAGSFAFNGQLTSLFTSDVSFDSSVEIHRGGFPLTHPVSNIDAAIHNHEGEGSVTFNGPFTFKAGTIGPIPSVAINGTFDWQGGNFTNAGVTTVGAGATGTISGTSAKGIGLGHRLINAGTLTHSGGAAIGITGVIENRGTFILAGANGTSTNGGGSGRNLENTATGVIRKAAPLEGQPVVAETLVQADDFINSGAVEVLSGTLFISPGELGIHQSAEYFIADQSVMKWGRFHKMDADTVFEGQGKFLIEGSTFEFNGTEIDTDVEFAAGTVNGTGVTFQGDVFEWRGGTFTSSGTTSVDDEVVTIATGTEAFARNSSVGITGGKRVFVNQGNFTVSCPVISIGSGAIGVATRLENHGVMTMQEEADFGGSGPSLVRNTGTFLKTASTGTAKTAMNGGSSGPMNFENSGTIEVRGGILEIPGPFTQTAGAFVLNGGNATKPGTPMAITGGSVQGGGTITGEVAVSGGTVAPGISAVPGVLAITGDLTLTSASKLSFDIGGTTPGTGHDQITEAGSTALNLNGSTLELGHLDGYTGGTVTILSSNAAITGAFGNVAHNQRIKTMDGKGTFRVSYPAGSFSVQLTSFQASPFDLTLAGDATVAENLPQGTLVGLLSAGSVKANPLLEFTLVSGAGSDDNASFRIAGNQLQVQTPLDFEDGGAGRSVRVRVTDLDNGEFIENVFPVTVLDVPSPASLALSNASVPENLPAGTAVGELSALPEEQAPFTFALVSGAGSTDNSRFSVEGGTLTIAAPLDFEATPGPFSIRMRVTNAGGETFEQVFDDLVVEDVPTPLDLAFTGGPVAENLPAGTLVGTLSATDVTDLTFSLVSGSGAEHNALFQISGTELLTASPLDFETVPVASVRVRVTNEGGETLEQSFPITIIDLGITSLSLAPQSVKENMSVGTVVGIFSPTVLPEGTGVTYALVSGENSEDNALFTVDGISLITAAVLDEEAAATRAIRVRGTDATGETFDQQFTVAIEDNDPNIVITNHSGVAVPASGSPVNLGLGLLSPEVLSRTFTLQNTGVAPLQNLAASLTGGDAALFTIVPASLPATLSPGASTTITLNSSPPDVGVHATTLRILSNDPDSPVFDIFLTSQAVTPIQIAQMAYVKDTRPTLQGDFGGAVAMDGDTLVISTTSSTDVSGGTAPAFIVLTLDPETNTWGNPLTFFDGNVTSVAISEDTIAVGDRFGNSGKGRVSIYVRSGNSWSLQQRINAPSALDSGDLFGTFIGLDGDRLIVSALFEDGGATGINGNQDQTVNSKRNSGAAYIYRRTGSTWTLDAYLKASNPDVDDAFGSAVAISGETAVVGARGESSGARVVNGNQGDNSSGSAGAAYVFTLNGGTWTQQAYLKAPNADPSDSFGTSVGISGETIVVGSAGDDGRSAGVDANPFDNSLVNSGAAHVFIRNGGDWTHQAYLKASNPDPHDLFGRPKVSIFNDTIVITSVSEGSTASGINGLQTDNTASGSGAAYLFRRTGAHWTQHAYLKASNTGVNDWFGTSVTGNGDRVVIGAPSEDSISSGINGDGSDNSLSNSGAVYVFDIIPPEVIVHDGPDTSSERLVHHQEEVVDFGTTPLGIAVTRPFTIINSTGRPLEVTSVQVPPFHFSVLDVPDSPIPPFGSATFFIRATAELSGVHHGSVSITTNHTEPLFEFPISVNVVAGLPGTLDPAFGTAGTGVATISSGLFSSDRAFAMALQSDGKIVVTGVSGSDSILVARLTADGRPDPTFNGGRPATRSLETEIEGFGGMAVAVHEGKIVVAASSGWQGFGGGAEASGSQRHALLRYNGNGALDTSFGSNGIYFGDAAVSAVEAVRGVEATASGKLIVVGRAGSAAFVSRINQNGTLDNSFGDQGYVRLRSSFFGAADWNTSTTADSVVILPDQSIVVGGFESRREISTGTDIDLASLWKLSANGQVLANENRERVAIDPFFSSGVFCSMSDLTLAPDGRIAAAGRVSTQSLPLSAEGRGVFHARFDADLNPDSSYSGGGRTGYLPAGSSQSSFHAMGIAVQPNLKPLIVGYEGGGSFSPGGPSQATFVQRYLAGGSADLNYGQSGRAIVNLPNSRAYAAAMAANGDLLVAGHTLESKIFVLRLHGDEKIPELVLRNGSRLFDPEIINGQAQGIGFGSPRIGLVVQKTFLVQNLGTAPLDLDTITVPASFRVVNRPGSVPAGASQPLVIEFSNDIVGVYSGEVAVSSNDVDEGRFVFPVFGTVQVNSPPVFGGFVAKTFQGQKVLISLDKILSKVTDANGDIVQVTGFSSVSAFGGTITEELDDVLVYVPHSTFSGQDQFSITFSDGESQIVGIVSVDVGPDPAFNPKNPPQLEFKPGGNLEVQFTGIPKRQYVIERSINLVDWDPIGVATSDNLGRVCFSDPAPPQPSAFYRITF